MYVSARVGTTVSNRLISAYMKPEQLLCPVTAAETIRIGSKDFLLISQGCQLKVYDTAERSTLRHAYQVFRDQVIHGIRCCESILSDRSLATSLILVWGDATIVILALHVDDDDEQLHCNFLSTNLTIADRILDVVFCVPQNAIRGHLQTHVAVALTFHNVLHLLSFEQKTHTPYNMAATPIAAGPSSILYSAHITWLGANELSIAVGTMLGRVLLWSYQIDEAIIQPHLVKPGQIIHSFAGHDGSVFGVRLSNLTHTALTGPSKRILASCGEDRTIRIWNVSNLLCAPLAHLQNLSETGDGFLTMEHNQASGHCLAMVTAHQSRIWGLRFLHSSCDSFGLLSFGEDSTVHVWEFNENVSINGKMQCEASVLYSLTEADAHSYHTGKNIWAVAARRSSDSCCSIYTGGADGFAISKSISISSDQSTNILSNRKPKMKPVYVSRNYMSTLRVASFPSFAKAELWTEDLFSALAGRWHLRRKLDSKDLAYPSGYFRGIAVLAPRQSTATDYTAELLYSEEGELTTDSGLLLKGSRKYVYRYQRATNSITAWFVKSSDEQSVDYLFHNLEFENSNGQKGQQAYHDEVCSLTASGFHLCVEDRYSAEYRFDLARSAMDQWSLKYKVSGPSKNYVTEAVYKRFSGNLECIMNCETSSLMSENSSIGSSLGIDALKVYFWISHDQILAVTERGHVLLGVLDNISTDDKAMMPGSQPINIPWSFRGKLDDLVSCSVITGIVDNIALLSGCSGTIYCYRKSSNSIHSIMCIPHKVTNLFVQHMQRCARLDHQDFGVVASCLGAVEAYCFLFSSRNKEDGEDTQNTQNVSKMMTLALPLHFVITSACFTSVNYLLVLGSRNGALCIFDLADASSTDSISSIDYFHRVHGENSVTSIQNVSTEESEISLLTTGRDGRFAMFYLSVRRSRSGLSVDLEQVLVSEPSFGPNIEGASFDTVTRDLILWGFRGKDFVVWNATKQRETMKIECGGAHRSWAYAPGNDGQDGGKLVWTKASACHVYMQAYASHRVVQLGSHGREIKSMAVAPATLRSSFDGKSATLIATGGEDTQIRLSYHYDDNNNAAPEPKCVGIISKHITGIQKLRWSSNGRFLFSAGGREELFVWQVSSISSLKIGTICHSQCPPVTESGYLRIMDFDVLVLDADNSERSEDFHFIFLSVIYSDSTIRVSPVIPPWREQHTELKLIIRFGDSTRRFPLLTDLSSCPSRSIAVIALLRSNIYPMALNTSS